MLSTALFSTSVRTPVTPAVSGRKTAAANHKNVQDRVTIRFGHAIALPRAATERRTSSGIKAAVIDTTQAVEAPAELSTEKIGHLSVETKQVYYKNIDGATLYWDPFVARAPGDQRHPSSVRFEQPLEIKDALEKLRALERQDGSTLTIDPMDIRRMSEAAEALSDIEGVTKVVGTLGRGRNSIVLELDSGELLKVSTLPQFARGLGPVRPFEPSFDVPSRSGEITQTGPRIYWTIQKKAKITGITPAHVKDVENRILRKGYKVQDLNEKKGAAQVGLIDDVPYLLDSQVAYL